MQKAIVFVIALCVFSYSTFANNPGYPAGTFLNVFAQSGLKLRSQPSLHADVLDIVDYGEKVEVIDNFDFCEDHADRIEWLDGHWIMVDYHGTAGYLFNAFLSTLPFPSDTDQVYQDGFSFAYVLNQYFDGHFALHRMLDSSGHQKVYILEDGIKIKNKTLDSHWSTELEIPKYQIPEIINLMRSMLPNRQNLIAFDRSLIFIEGDDGFVEEVRTSWDDRVSIKKKKNGNILVKASGYSGC